MTRRKKTAQITVRIDLSLKDAAQRASAKDHRSLGSLIDCRWSTTFAAGAYSTCHNGNPKRPHEPL